jgi:hypothetical protein
MSLDPKTRKDKTGDGGAPYSCENSCTVPLLKSYQTASVRAQQKALQATGFLAVFAQLIEHVIDN